MSATAAQQTPNSLCPFLKVSAAVREDIPRPQMGLNTILGPFWIIAQKPGPESKFCSMILRALGR